MNSEKQMESKPTLSRRKFLVRAGAGSLPVVMSLQSGSAWGCVDLSCTPGKDSLSNSASKVASVTANKAKAPYQRPQWSNIETIRKAFYVDFNSYLLTPWSLTLCTATESVKKGITYYTFTEIKKPGVTFTTSELNSWWNLVKPTSHTKLYLNEPGTTVTADRLKRYNNDLSVLPAIYNNTIILPDTKCSVVCPGMSGSIGPVLDNYSSKRQAILAAIIGSIWERHPRYKQEYQGREMCFPNTDVLAKAFENAVARNKLTQLDSLVRYYMEPLKK